MSDETEELVVVKGQQAHDLLESIEQRLGIGSSNHRQAGAILSLLNLGGRGVRRDLDQFSCPLSTWDSFVVATQDAKWQRRGEL